MSRRAVETGPWRQSRAEAEPQSRGDRAVEAEQRGGRGRGDRAVEAEPRGGRAAEPWRQGRGGRAAWRQGRRATETGPWRQSRLEAEPQSRGNSAAPSSTSRFVSSRGAPDDPRGGQGWPEASCQGGPRLARGERLMSSHRVAGHQRELLMIQEGPRLAQGKSPRGGQGWLEECRLRLVSSRRGGLLTIQGGAKAGPRSAAYV